MMRTRSLFWVSLLATLALAASGCGDGGGASPVETEGDAGEADSDPGETDTDAAETGADAGDEDAGELEVFSWWTSGGEAAALDSLFESFRAAAPGVEVINAAVAGGGGTDARPVLQTRLAGGDPPDTWQLHSGSELFDQYAAPGFLESLTALYEGEGWFDVIPADLIDQLRHDGEMYAVLVGVHRGNGLWYNKPLLDEHGIQIGDALSIDEFFDIADQLQTAGVTPLCLGDTDIWTATQLFENTLLGVAGPDSYQSLFTGELAWDSDEVKEAAEVFSRMLTYQNSDHAALSWDQAVQKLIEGSCAFNSMGDWAYGEFVNAELTDNEDFGWVSHPGTDGAFMTVTDGFGIADGAPHPDEAQQWLRTIGSADAQVAFNQLKGAIPARTDIDRDTFGTYHNWSMDSFANDKLVPTLVHGSAAPADFVQSVHDATTSFVVTGDVDAFTSELAAAAASTLGE